MVAIGARVAAIPGTDRYLLWLLRLMKRMEEPPIDSLHRFWQDLRKAVITRMVKTANDEASIIGLAKWFSWLSASMQPQASHTAVDMPRLRIDKTQLIKIVEREQGDARFGAVLILAHGRAVTYDEARRLLRLENTGWEINECWAELIEGTVKSSRRFGGY